MMAKKNQKRKRLTKIEIISGQVNFHHDAIKKCFELIDRMEVMQEKTVGILEFLVEQEIKRRIKV